MREMSGNPGTGMGKRTRSNPDGKTDKCDDGGGRLRPGEHGGNKPGSAYAYNVKELRNREIDIARQAEQAYETFIRNWQRCGPAKRRTGAASEERR
jgi:hypothetical protein